MENFPYLSKNISNDDLKFACFVLNKTVEKFGKNYLEIKFSNTININDKTFKTVEFLENKAITKKLITYYSNYEELYEKFNDIYKYVNSFNGLQTSDLINDYSLEMYFNYLDLLGFDSETIKTTIFN